MFVAHISAGWLLGMVLLAGARLEAAPRIELEVAVEKSAPATARQRWLQLLAGANLDNITLRSAREGEEPEIVNRGTETRPSFKIVGILTAGEQLVLPGGKFGAGDIGRLKQFLATLGEQGISGVTEKKAAFGLTAEQLIALSEDLEATVDADTLNVAPDKAIAAITPLVKHRLVLSAPAASALKDAAPCRDEVKGLSAGTALAVLMRPYGLVLEPRVAGRDVEMHIVVPNETTQVWPVGWPSEKTDREALPTLFEFINVEIEGIELPKALAALQERIAAPMLFDHNQLAKHGIEPEKIEVSVPAGRTYYKRILEKILFQARLKSEIRTDETGKPIIWITTIKP